jgi:hypothetical protein
VALEKVKARGSVKVLYRAAKIGIAVIGIGTLLLASVAHNNSLAAGSSSDKGYRDKLVGTWTEKSAGPVATLERTVSFFADGTYRSTARLAKPEKVIDYQNRGTWSIENGVLYITVFESSRADIPLGLKTTNKIISLTETEAITESAEGIRTKAYRKK